LTVQQRSCSAIMMDELLTHMAEKKTVLRQKINAFYRRRARLAARARFRQGGRNMATPTWRTCWRMPARA
jgi:hypothetical protein